MKVEELTTLFIDANVHDLIFYNPLDHIGRSFRVLLESIFVYKLIQIFSSIMVNQPQKPQLQSILLSQSQSLLQSSLQSHTKTSSSTSSTSSTSFTSSTLSTSSSYTLLLWTAIWFALCASLVKKHVDLLTVFFAYSGSFAIASVLPKGYKTKTNLGILASILSLLLLSIQRPYAALSIMMGHLAFGLWYSALYYCQRTSRVVEDAISLAVGVVLLSIHSPLQIHKHYHPYILVWTLYKFIQGMISTSYISSDPIVAVIVADNSDNYNNNNKSWIIHGTHYDLSAFPHPGGKEALALGQGRDCTHLFESYHPFTTRHEIVLQKYKKHTFDNVDAATTANTIKPPRRDLFYEELKHRVYQTLQEQGFNPSQDRTAPLGRVAYYCLVAIGLTLTTVAHIQVRHFNNIKNNGYSTLQHLTLHCIECVYQ